MDGFPDDILLNNGNFHKWRNQKYKDKCLFGIYYLCRKRKREQDQDGNKVSSKDLLGKKTIIYFYPKDNTSGCTAEACNIRDNFEALKTRGYNVVGVSKDSAASHRKFKDKYELPFTLLSDTSTQMLQTFGAWGEKKMYGKTVMGTIRKTFIFDEEGILTEIIEKVDTRNHAAQILG